MITCDILIIKAQQFMYFAFCFLTSNANFLAENLF